MLMRHFALPCMLLTTGLVSWPVRSAHAGPLIDWLFHRPAYSAAVPVGTPYPVNTPYPATAGYAPALPYNAGYTPYSTGYAPYSTGYTPYSTGYTPYSGTPYSGTPYSGTPYSSAPYAAGYSGYTGYTPYGVAYPSTGYRNTIGAQPAQTSYPMPSYGTYYGSTSPVIGANGYGYVPQKVPNNVIAPAQAIMPSTNPVTLVPDYRSTYARTPVTYYRPVLTTDPNNGSQVVALAPCTSYEYQTQRVPTWGLTQVYNGGATLPAVTPTAPVVSPTYSLPRGGIPLAGPVPSTQPYTTAYGAYPSMATSTVIPVAPTTGSIITPASPGAVTAPYSSGYSNYASNYGNYSALQPGAALPPTSNYSTSPYYGNGVNGTSRGSTGGGSTGSYVAPPTTTYGAAPYGSTTVPYGSTTTPGYTSPSYTTPGLTTPGLSSPGLSAPSLGTPGLTVPGTTMPGTSMPGSIPMPSYPTGPSIMPPSGQVLPPSSDPAANATPNLQGANKPQLQNFVQQPMPSTTRSFNPSPAPSTQEESNKVKLESSQGLLPIPVPEDYKHQPRWNPGLLKEQDTTAAMNRPVDPQVAWGSKPIRWASLKTSTGKRAPDLSPPELPPARLREMPKFTPPVTEIPEVNFQPPKPARLELEEAQPQKVDPKIDPKGRRTDVWGK